MIHFVTSKTYAVDTMPKSLKPLFHVVRSERLQEHLDRPPPGAWIFAEPEDLRTPFGQAFEHRLKRDNTRYLNTSRSMGRRALLNKLSASGVNSFNAYRVKPSGPWRYPAFIRSTIEHTGNLTPLLHNDNDLGAALRSDRLLASPEKVLIEYLDTSVDGVFRTYSVLKIGDRLIPHQLLFGRRWAIRQPIDVSPEEAAEETAFLNTPVLSPIAQAFETANIAYGLLDYSLYDGHPQIWGIDTNPYLFPRNRHVRPEPIEEAFSRLDS